MDFTQPWNYADVTFILQGRKIYANKATLAMSSQVFMAMFTSEFSEKKMTEIPLPNKKFGDFLQLMQILQPLSNTCLDNTNVAGILHLAHEYQIHQLVERCEKVLVRQRPSIHNLILADKFSLQELRQVFFEYLKTVPYSKLKDNPELELVDKDTRIEVFERHFMYQQPSIENLLLAEKYDEREVYEKCLKHMKNTPLSKLKTEPGFANLKPDTLNEVLTHKAEQLEALKTEASNLTNWGALESELCTGLSNQPHGLAQGFEQLAVAPITIGGGFGKPKAFNCWGGQVVQHKQGNDKTCVQCLQYRITEIDNVLKKY